MSVQVRKPAKQIFYPPQMPAPVDHYDYVTGDSWKSVADRKQRLVWDLILYNFQCKNPEEVNWCMGEHFGCTESHDGKNFSFRTKDRTRRIYIPPADFHFLDEKDAAARDLTLTALTHEAALSIDFELDGHLVNFRLLNDVRKLILSNSILVMDLTDGLAPESMGALWNPLQNILLVRNPEKRTATKMAVIVHEAVHAGMDLRGKKAVRKLGEACGHVAQAIFNLWFVGDLPGLDPFAIPGPKHNQWAAYLGKEALLHLANTGTTYVLPGTDESLKRLQTYISIWPDYAQTANKDIVADGI